MPKLQYIDMITQAILQIGDRKGASSQAIWKFLQMKFPEDIRDRKLFQARLSKVSKEDNQVNKVAGQAQRFKLDSNYRARMIRALAKGENVKATRTNAMTKKTKDPKKNQTKLKKNKMSKTVKGKQTLKKDKKTKAKNSKAKGKKDDKKDKKKDDKKKNDKKAKGDKA